jgi:hypothetical protein
MRVIASGRRIASLTEAKLSLVWQWGLYSELFEHTPDISLLPQEPSGIPYVAHKLEKDGGTFDNRKCPIDVEQVVIRTCFAFGMSHESCGEKEVSSWLPALAPNLRAKVEDFRAGLPNTITGVHFRRTDNWRANELSSDKEYWKVLDALSDPFFVCTDNLDYERIMATRYLDRCYTYPKLQIAKRWPRRFSMEDTKDDAVDLHILASCSTIIGSRYSSYTRTAALLSGPRVSCVLLG